MANGAGKPKPAFFVVSLVVVAALVGFAFYRWNAKKSDAPKGGGNGSDQIYMKSINGSDGNWRGSASTSTSSPS